MRCGPSAYDVIPSSIQACMIQAMLSGAISRAPRWSVVVETGKATACSRGITSRPPAEATAGEDRQDEEGQAGGRQQRQHLAGAFPGELAAEVGGGDDRGHRQREDDRTDDPQPATTPEA